VKCRPRPGPRHRIACEPDTGSSHATFAPGRDGSEYAPKTEDLHWLVFAPGTIERYVAALIAADETEAASTGEGVNRRGLPWRRAGGGLRMRLA
jgi:hypothetical protein